MSERELEAARAEIARVVRHTGGLRPNERGAAIYAALDALKAEGAVDNPDGLSDSGSPTPTR